MISALDTYLGWETPQHRKGCKRPTWDIGIRQEERELRYHFRGAPPLQHSCPDEDCPHGNTFDRTVVRIVCKGCGAAQVISGEHTPDVGATMTSTEHLGYGLAPRQAAGLLLWPGQPWLNLGRAMDGEPHDFVVTRTGVKTVTEDTVVGQLTQGRGKLNGVLWTALAVPDAEGQFGYGQRIRYVHANDGRDRGGSALRTVRAAARWVGARLAEHEAALGGAA